MNRFLWIWFFISAGQLCAQRVIDVSGTWEGTLSVLNSSSLLKLVIHQNEEKLTGYVYTKSLDEKDSTKERFTGDIEGNKLSIVEVETIYKIGPGCLSRLDLAFSRDQSEKIYVQQRMLEEGKEIYGCLENGGHFYVCGDASRMAKDVDRTLNNIIQESRARRKCASDHLACMKAKIAELHMSNPHID